MCLRGSDVPQVLDFTCPVTFHPVTLPQLPFLSPGTQSPLDPDPLTTVSQVPSAHPRAPLQFPVRSPLSSSSPSSQTHFSLSFSCPGCRHPHFALFPSTFHPADPPIPAFSPPLSPSSTVRRASDSLANPASFHPHSPHIPKLLLHPKAQKTSYFSAAE